MSAITDPARPLAQARQTDSAAAELQLEEIQGNCLGGFSKDQQAMLFLRVTDATVARCTLTGDEDTSLWQDVQGSSSEQVVRFNTQFKALRSRGVPEQTISATWTNLVCTHAGLRALGASEEDLAHFPNAFRAGMAARAEKLGDVGASAPDGWEKVVDWAGMHLLVIVASDEPSELDPTAPGSRVARYLAQLTAPGSGLELAVPSDDVGQSVQVPADGFGGPGQIYGRTRSDAPKADGPQAGHEHFGFKDGVSQPGIRGIDFPSDPVANPNQGNPGQDLLHPGEFVVGYPRQKPVHKPGVDGPNPDPGLISGSGRFYDEDDFAVDPAGSRVRLPSWAANGSFLVFRRLEQDVAGFRRHVADLATTLGLSEDLIGAKMVGRYRSGAPLETREFQSQPAAGGSSTDPGVANPALANDDDVNNNFEFGGDPEGDTVPLAAHIRKAYPRDQVPQQESGLAEAKERGRLADDAESRTQTHRLLRRGIPYGGSLGAAVGGAPEDRRGLLFLAYQSDIERQFEFVQAHWVNDPGFPREGAGKDPVITPRQGANDAAPIKGCPFHAGGNAAACPVSLKHFVTTRGGGYFFSPSVSAWRELLGVKDDAG